MTFEDIRDRVLLALDTSTSITGDLKTAVDAAIKDIYDEVVTEVRPDELLTASSTLTIEENVDTVNIGATDPGFGITDFEKEHALFIDGADEPWINRDYRTWLRGDDKRNALWTFHNDQIIIRPAPSTGSSYSAVLYYYKTPATITDAGTPELPREGHQTLVWGTLTKFPHLFLGDKQLLLLKYEKDFANAVARLKRSRAASQKLRSLHPKRHVAANPNIVFAGT